MVYVDNRDWPRYNEALVARGEIFLGLDAVEEWEQELKGMNRGKEGARFMFSDGFITLLTFIRLLFHLPYRQTEGFVTALSKHIEHLAAPDYSTLNKRVNKLKVPLPLEDMQPDDEPLTIAVDASGIKVANSGDWIRRVWKKRKGYLKVHVAVDVKSKKIAALKVTREKTGDNRMFKPLVKTVMKARRVRRVLADGAYDARVNFNFLAQHGVDAVIRVRKSSVARSRGSVPRKLAVAEQLESYPAWRLRHGYGFRWRAEGVFSVWKRVFGEYASAKKYWNMVKEMLLKASLYNLLTQITANSLAGRP